MPHHSPRFTMPISTYGLWMRSQNNAVPILAARVRRACLNVTEQLACWLNDRDSAASQLACHNLAECAYRDPRQARQHRESALLAIRLAAQLKFGNPWAVNFAYLHGATWQNIAEAAGLTLEDARRRWLACTTDPDNLTEPLAIP